jgi:hypothetical protein
LKIIGIRRWEDPCFEGAPDTFDFELEPVRAPELFRIEPRAGRAGEFPFDVCVIYPASRAARSLPVRQLRPSTLPRGFVPEVVAAAVDLNGDGRPEVVITKFCCGDERRPSATCDLTCSKTFRRARGVWRLIDKSNPC